MTPITIEPNSGVKMAGVKVTNEKLAANSDVKYIEIVFVSELFLLVKVFFKNGFIHENSLVFGDDVAWYLYEEPKAEVECSDRQWSMEERIERIEGIVTFIANLLKGVEKV